MYSKSLEIINRNGCIIHVVYWEARGDLMVSALVYVSSGPGSSPGRGHCVVFLGKTLTRLAVLEYALWFSQMSTSFRY